MKAALQAKITEIIKDAELKNGNTNIAGMVKLKLIATKGRVDTALNNAQFIGLIGELYLREAIANQIKIGATITINLSDEGPDEGPV